MRSDVSLDRLKGCLLGCALGDALGLPAEGLSADRVARRFGALDRFQLVGRTGFVSDDTEQLALVAESLALGADPAQVVRHFRWRLRFWFARLPFGIGFATLRACLKLWLGLSASGVSSGGNGAAMRASALGAVAEPGLRRALGDALAQVTHTHAFAVQGARYVAELSAACLRADAGADRRALARAALEVVDDAQVRAAVEQGLAADPERPGLAATGFVLHSLAACTWAFVHGPSPLEALRRVIRLGGDADTHAAIVGAWAGGLHGEAALPADLLAALQDGPFGPSHLRGLARALAGQGEVPRWSALLAFARNLALYPVVLAHGFRRLLP